MAKKKLQGKSKPKAQRKTIVKTYVPKRTAHPCSALLARSFIRPFDPLIRGKVCWPAFPQQDTWKMAAVANVIVSTNANGIGFVMFDPSVANDKFCICYSNVNTFVGTTFPAFGSGTGYTQTYVGTLPYASNNMVQFNGGTSQGRIVSVGLRFRSLSTKLNEGGMILAVNTPNSTVVGLTLTGSPTISSVRKLPFRTEKSVELGFCPPDADNIFFAPELVSGSSNNMWFPWSQGTVAAPQIGLIFQSSAANQLIDVDFIQHMEFRGPLTSTVSTTTDIVPLEELGAVTAAAASASQTPNSELSPAQDISNTLRSYGGVGRMIDEALAGSRRFPTSGAWAEPHGTMMVDRVSKRAPPRAP
jgi:hypothetical protein